MIAMSDFDFWAFTVTVFAMAWRGGVSNERDKQRLQELEEEDWAANPGPIPRWQRQDRYELYLEEDDGPHGHWIGNRYSIDLERLKKKESE